LDTVGNGHYRLNRLSSWVRPMAATETIDFPARSAGTFQLLFNVSGATLSARAYGFSADDTCNADGTMIEVVTGHVAPFLFPACVAAGLVAPDN
jgi:hypothetical protein